jgi:hypothetical protein
MGTDILLGASFSGTANFGGSNLVSNANNDFALALYDGNGVHKWSISHGGTLHDNPMGVAASAIGTVALAGQAATNVINMGDDDLFGFGGFDAVVGSYLANPGEPVITDIADIGNDQGRRVMITFAGSAGDDPLASDPVTSYEAYRRIDAPPSSLVATPPAPTRQQLLDTGWIFAGSTPAHEQDEYTLAAETIGDSTVALGAYNSTFFIRAASNDPGTFYDSAPDSGYSKDNLAPGIPDNLVFETGELAWDESSAGDFDFFTVYGSNVDAFGSAVVVDYSVAPGLDVSGSPYVFYYVTATDFSGNEGKPAKVNTLSNASGTPKSYVLSVSSYPNPFNPRTTVSYTVPYRGHVSVNVYDTRGAHVATLVDTEKAAGAYSADWNPGGAASSGVYFARIEHNGSTRSKKMVLLK